MPLKHTFTPMSEDSVKHLVPGQWLMNRSLRFVQFIRRDGEPGNLIWCSDVCIGMNEEISVDIEDAVLYHPSTLSIVCEEE